MKRIFLIAVAAIFFSAPAINLNPASATDQADNFSQILSSLRTMRAHSLTAQGRATPAGDRAAATSVSEAL